MLRLSGTLLALCTILSAELLSAQDRVEIIKRSKAATALVDLGEYGSGSSFCIHGSGLFLTNYHVVRSVALGDEATLVLDSSLKTERKIQARFVNYDEENDLALLKSVEKLDLRPLELGNVEELIETQNVTAFGYPFGKRLSTETEEYPSISINVGRISALRRQNSELRVIQFDAAVNPGNSGGPILNDGGKVIGVTVGTIRSSQVSFAIPANIIQVFVRRPVVIPDRIKSLKFADLIKPVEFDVELLEIPGTIEPDRLEFQFRYGSQQTALLEAQKTDGGFRVSAQPFRLPEDEKLFRVILTGKQEQTSLDVPEGSLTVGKRRVKLSTLRRLDRRQDKFIVTFNDDTKVFAAVNGWEQLPDREISLSRMEDVERIDVLCHRSFAGDFGYQLNLYAGEEQVLTRLNLIEVEGEPYTLSKAQTQGDLHSPPIDRVVIETMIDGQDTLEFRWEGIHWNHHASNKPGITDSKGRYTLVNGQKWYPEWEYTTADSNNEDESVVFPLKLGGASWRMKVLGILDPQTRKHTPNRGKVTLDSQNYYLKIKFDDSSPGAGIYRILLEKNLLGVEAQLKSQKQPGKKSGGSWDFEKIHHQTVHDAGSGEPSMEMMGNPIASGPQTGLALQLDKSPLKLGDVGKFSADEPFSCSCWAYLDSSFCCLFGKMVHNKEQTQGYDLIYTAESFAFDLIAKPKNRIRVQTTTRVPRHKWVHVAVTYDGSRRATGIKIYLNGQQDDLRIVEDTLTEQIETTSPFVLGARDSSFPMQGRIDDLRIYRDLLTLDEVLAILHRQPEDTDTLQDLKHKLALHWSFEELNERQIVEQTGSAPRISIDQVRPKTSVETESETNHVLYLSGSGQCNAGRIGNFDSQDAFSLGGWISLGLKPQFDGPISLGRKRKKIGGTERGYEFKVFKNHVMFELFHNSRKKQFLSLRSQEPIPRLDWHHLTATYDGSMKASGVKVYLNGQPITMKVIADNLTGTIENHSDYILGAIRYEPTLEVKLDDLFIEEGVISQAELTKRIAGSTLAKP